MKKGLILDLFVHLLVGAYAIYVGITQITNGTFISEVTFWVSIALIFIGNSLTSKLEVVKYELIIENFNKNLQRLYDEAVVAKKKFEKENKK